MTDLADRLRELRRAHNLTQRDLAALCSVGEKTLSSFETTIRIGGLKVAQLQRILGAYGLSEAEFFAGHSGPNRYEQWFLSAAASALMPQCECGHDGGCFSSVRDVWMDEEGIAGGLCTGCMKRCTGGGT